MKASPCVGLFCEVNMRNDLLAKIVAASGGTVTNKDSRNELLRDWLSAVDNPPEINYTYRMDGLTEHWQLSEPISISSSDDYEMTLTLMSETLDFYIYGSSTTANTNRLVFATSGTALFGLAFSNNQVSSAPLQSESEVKVVRASGVTSFRVDGVELTSSGLITDLVVSRLGGRYDGTTSIPSLSGYIKDFSFKRNGVEEIAIPLTNKDQGETQQPTVGAVTATMIGYNEAGWEVYP